MRMLKNWLAAGALITAGCDQNQGADGADGNGCHVTDNHDGSATVSCDDGSTATIRSGTDGVGTLTRTVTIPAGDECESGGYQVEIGNDSNQDGVLSDSEVYAVLYRSCTNDGIDINGSVEIRDGVDLLFLQQVRSISGDLVLLAPDVTELRAPILTSILGNFDVSQGAALRVLEMPRLSEVGGDIMTITGGGANLGELFHGSASALESIHLPELRVVHGRFKIGSYIDNETLPLLTTIELPLLESAELFSIRKTPILEIRLPSYMSGSIHIVNNSNIVSIYTPSLTNCPVIEMADNGPPGTEIEITPLSSLAEVGILQFFQANFFDDIDIPSVATADTLSFTTGGSAIRMASVTTIVNLHVHSSSQLSELDFPQLTYVNDYFQFIDSPLLSCEIGALFDQLSPEPERVFIEGCGECP